MAKLSEMMQLNNSIFFLADRAKIFSFSQFYFLVYSFEKKNDTIWLITDKILGYVSMFLANQKFL